MIDKLLTFIAPHHCFGCGFTGTLLCDSCKYDVISEAFLGCLSCGRLAMSISGLCSACKVPYERAWCVADRRDYLRCLIDAYKFENAKAAHVPLASLLDDRLVDLPVNAVVVPIPTIASHIRQRGYDHMLLVAREFARRRNLPLDLSLKRNTHTTQRGAGVKERILQAKNAFICSQKLDPNKIYLILDDVVTSGATVRYAAEALRKAGATSVWVASISRQPLD